MGRTTVTRWLVLAALLGIAAALRCTGGDDAAGCTGDEQCPGGRCVDGSCSYADAGADADGLGDADAEPDGDADGVAADGDGADDADAGPDADAGADDGTTDAPDDVAADDGGPDPYRDTDGDTIGDADEGSGDADGDTVPNDRDLDSDGDGIPDAIEAVDADVRTPPPDSDRDGTADFLDTDSDGDTIPDVDEWLDDTDRDGVPAYRDYDSDGDGIFDPFEAGDDDPLTLPVDTDSDTAPDFLDLDSDGDWISDEDETVVDSDLDTIPDYLDLDSEDDGVPDADEAGDLDLDTPPQNCDGDTLANFRDTDSDNDGVRDIDEVTMHGTDPCMADTDGDTVTDLIELTYGSGALDPADSPRARGDFVFVVAHSAPPDPPIAPDPLRDTLSFSTALQKADVYITIDTSGSMGGEISNLTAGFRTTVVPGIAARIPNTQFGVGRFESCPSSSCANSMNNIQDITSDVAAVDAALGTIPGTTCGGSEPYRQTLWLLATGDTSGFSGRVRPIPRRCTDPATVGWPCFRPDAVKIIIQCGDEPMSQSNSCSPARSHTEVVTVMNAAQIKYIGIESGSSTLRTDMQNVGRDTGSVDGTTGLPLVFTIASSGTGLSTTVVDAVDTLARNVPIRVDAVPEDDPSDAVDAVAEFVDYMETNTSGITVMGRVCTTDLAVADGDGDGHSDYFTTVYPGTSVCWDIVPKPNVTVPATDDAQIFLATINVIGDLFTPLDSRQVYFLVPPLIEGSQ